MITARSDRVQPFALKMDLIRRLDVASPLSCSLRKVVEKILLFVLIPFALIADLVINSTRVLANGVIAGANYVRGAPSKKIISPPPLTPVKQKILPPCTKTHEALMDDLIHTLATNSYVSLVFTHGTRLREIGQALQSVHPLTFFRFVTSTPQRKKQIQIIFRSLPTRWCFMSYEGGGGSLTAGLRREAANNTLWGYLDDFVKTTKISPKAAREFFATQDWEGLVTHLISL